METKANAIVHVLDDVRINLETLGEQKAVIDHVAEKVAQLEFMLQEARNTLRTLQHERELAERIEQGIKQLRSKTMKTRADDERRKERPRASGRDRDSLSSPSLESQARLVREPVDGQALAGDQADCRAAAGSSS